MLFLFGALSQLALNGASAQPTGTRIDPNGHQLPPSLMSDDQVRDRLVQTYAACLVRSHPRLVEAMLGQPYLSPAQAQLVRQITDANCLGPNEATLRYPPDALVGRLAQALALDRYPRADVQRFTGMTDEAADQLGLVPRNDPEDMAFCILRRDPQAVRALIDTPWNGPEEAAAIRALRPQLGPCAPAGATLALNAAAVRLMLATGLYRALTIIAAGPPARH